MKDVRAKAYYIRAYCYYLFCRDARAIRDISKAISLDPDETLYRYGKARIYACHYGFCDIAEKICKRALAKDTTSAEGYYRELAHIAKHRSNIDEAIVHLDSALKYAPDNADIYLGRARYYAYLHDYEKATDDYIKVLSLRPHDSCAIDGLENISSYRIPKVKEQIAQTPDNSDWYEILAGFYKDGCRFRDAIGAYKKAYECDPDNRYLHGIANCYASIGKFDMAFAYLDSIESIDPTDSGVLFNKAYILMAQGETCEAEDVFSSLIKEEPDNEYYYCLRGEAREGCGYLQDAIEDYTSALAHSDGTNAKLYYLWRGLAYQKLGDDIAAMSDLTKASYERDLFVRNYAEIALGRGSEADTDLDEVDDDTFAKDIYVALLKLVVGDSASALGYVRNGLEKNGGECLSLLVELHFATLREIEGYEEVIEELIVKRNPEPEVDSMVRFVHPDVVDIHLEGDGCVKGDIDGYVVEIGISDEIGNPIISRSTADDLREKGVVGSDDGIEDGDIVVIPDIEIGTLHLKDVVVEVSSDYDVPIIVNSEVLGELGDVEVVEGGRCLRVRRGR